jgi:enoyl-CoA hydratase
MTDQNEAVSGTVTFELAGDVAVIRFDDGKANALSHPALDALIAAVHRGGQEAKAIAVIGRPGRFSAGFDLPSMTAGTESARSILGKGAELALQIFRAPVPVVLGCTGHALAMGAILLMSADARIGAEGAYKIGLNEVAIGMGMPQFVIELARHRLDPPRTHLAIQLATVTDAAGAVEVGFLDRAIPEGEVEKAAIAMAADLAGTLHPTAFRITRDHLRGEAATRIERALRLDLESFKVEV